MSTVLITLLLAGVVEDPRGFSFTVPEGFVPFPGFTPSGAKLHAYGKNLGTPEAITFTIDAVDGPATAGTPSRSCGDLMNSIERTVGKPMVQKWGKVELSGVRMVMTHVFGEVVVYCVDVPVLPEGISVKVSGKPANDAMLHSTFDAVTSSVSAGRQVPVAPLVGVAVLAIGLVVIFRRLRRK